MATIKTRTSRGGPSVKIAANYPQDLWKRFEEMCFTQAGMSGRETLKSLVAYSVLSGAIPVPKAKNSNGTTGDPIDEQPTD